MDEPYFAGLPARMLGDDNLKFLHWKVMAAVAVHDRLSTSSKRGNRQGKGCTAGNPTLAQKVGCNYSRLSATIGDLVRWGYLHSETDPIKRRNRTLRVIYSEEDAAFMGGVESLPARKNSTGPADTLICAQANISSADQGANCCLEANDTPSIVCPQAGPSPKIVCLRFEKTSESHRVADDKKLSETLRDSAEAGRDSVETGRDTRERARLSPREQLDQYQLKHGTGAILAMFERAFEKDPASLDLELWHDWLEATHDALIDDDERLFRWTGRLLEKVAFFQDVLLVACQPGAIDDRDLVQSFWVCGGTIGREALAARHGLTVGELQRFGQGESRLPAPKITAMARSIRGMLDQSQQPQQPQQATS